MSEWLKLGKDYINTDNILYLHINNSDYNDSDVDKSKILEVVLTNNAVRKYDIEKYSIELEELILYVCKCLDFISIQDKKFEDVYYINKNKMIWSVVDDKFIDIDLDVDSLRLYYDNENQLDYYIDVFDSSLGEEDE